MPGVIMQRLPLLIILLIIIPFPALTGCPEPSADPGVEEESQLLEQGYVTRDPEYIVDEDGTVYYSDNRTSVENGAENDRNPRLAPPFPGAQRYYPSGENTPDRESYITRAPYEAIEQYYRHYLATGSEDPSGGEQPGNPVNSILSKDEDERRQTALFVNDSDGERGGMKVMLKDFPAQDAVQIILTTLDATPTGLSPTGVYVTSEQVRIWAEEYESQQEEYETRRSEAEEQAVDAEVVEEADTESNTDEEDQDEGDE
jgi:hypothetical protein